MKNISGSIESFSSPDELLNSDDFLFISKFAKLNFGLNITESKRPLVHSRLSRRLRELGINHFNDYRQILESKQGEVEKTSLLSALTTNVTEFFREKHHFETLKDQVLPELIRRSRQGEKIRIWSAGCSTGQEPFSIAMSILDLCPTAERLDIKVVATDIDPAVIEIASSGIYNENELNKLPIENSNKYFKKLDGNFSKICDDALRLTEFSVVNLIEKLRFSNYFSVIFCRNVAIYFDKPTQQKIWLKFCDLLEPGGTLFIGHSERISGPAEEKFVSGGITTYVKSGH